MKKHFILLLTLSIFRIVQAQVTQVPQVYTNNNSTTLYIRSSATSSGTSSSSLRIGSKIGAIDIVQNFSDPTFTNFIKVCKPGTSGNVEYGYIPSNYYYAKIDEVNNYATVTTTTLNIRTGPGTSYSSVTISGTNATFGNGSIVALTGNTNGVWYEVYLTVECSQATGWCSAGSSGTLLSINSNTQNYKVIGGTVCNNINNCSNYLGNIQQAVLQFSSLGSTYSSGGYYQYKVPTNWSGTLTCSHSSYNTSSPTSYNIFASNHSYTNNFLLSNTTASCSYNNSKICYVSDNNPSGINTDNQTINVGTTWTKYFQFNNKGGASSCSGTGTCDAQNYRLIPKSLQRNGVTVNAASYITNESRPTFSISANQTGYASYSCQFNTSGTYYMVFDIAYTDGSILTSFGTPLGGTVTVNSSCTPVSVTTHPQSQSKTVGNTATFSVVAGGTSPFTYQWRKNGTNISGATSSSYTTPTLTISDNGSTYSCYVTNCSGGNNTTSNSATLTVTNSCTPVSVTTHPQSQSKTVGNTATFSVVAGGTSPFTYQWRKNGTNISGATSSSYTTPTLTISDNGSTYSCYVTNCSGGNNTTSNSATLTVSNSNTPSQIIINNIIKNNTRFTNPKLLWSGYTNQTPDIIKICADASNATEITFTNNTGVNSNNIRFLIASDPSGNNSDKSGYFIRDAQNLSINGNIIKSKLTHPKYLEPQYKPYRIDTIIVVDVNNTNIRLFSIPIQIYRAPVVLVHGFTGGDGGISEESFHTTKDFLYNTGDYLWNFIRVVNYHSTSYMAFNVNQYVVPNNINNIFDEMRFNKISCGKVDVVGFSMGGCLSRIYLQSDAYIEKKDIHKLITINTPHFGSQWGNLFKNNRTRPVVLPILNTLIRFDLGSDYINENNYGAVYDLSVNSQAMNNLLNSSSNLNKSTVPTHTIGSTYSYSNRSHSIIEDVIRAVFILDDPLFSSFNSFADNLFINLPHDGAVRLNSQSGGLSFMYFSQYPDQFHLGANKNTYIMSELSNALNINSSNTNYFTQSGFIPTIQESNYRLFQPDTFNQESIIQQGSITFDYPSDGQYFMQNSILPINISSNNGINRLLLASISNTGTDVLVDTLLSNGNIIFTIPSNAFGKISFIVLGYNDNNFIDYDTVTIFINQTSTLDSIISYSTPLYLQQYYTGAVDIRAYYNDGNDYIIYDKDGVQYTITDTTIAKYYYGNLIYGKKKGSTTLTVSYGGKSIGIPVFVTDRDTTIGELPQSIVTSIKNNSIYNQFNIKVYPNPNNGLFTLEFESISNDDNELIIFNNIGQQVYFEKLKTIKGKQTKDLLLKNIPKGIYHIQLKSGNKIATQKMVVN